MGTEQDEVSEILTAEFCNSLDFDAVSTEEDARRIEKASQTWSKHRKVALTILTRSKQDLLDQVHDADESLGIYVHMLEIIRAYQEQVNTWVAQAKMAEARVVCMLGTLEVSLGASSEGDGFKS